MRLRPTGDRAERQSASGESGAPATWCYFPYPLLLRDVGVNSIVQILILSHHTLDTDPVKRTFARWSCADNSADQQIRSAMVDSPGHDIRSVHHALETKSGRCADRHPQQLPAPGSAWRPARDAQDC